MVIEDCKILRGRLIHFLQNVTVQDEFCAFLWAQAYLLCKELYDDIDNQSSLIQLRDKMLQDELLKDHAVELLSGVVHEDKLLPLVNESSVFLLVPGMPLTNAFLHTIYSHEY